MYINISLYIHVYIILLYYIYMYACSMYVYTIICGQQLLHSFRARQKNSDQMKIQRTRVFKLLLEQGALLNICGYTPLSTESST